jgi:hypothetical protein
MKLGIGSKELIAIMVIALYMPNPGWAKGRYVLKYDKPANAD